MFISYLFRVRKNRSKRILIDIPTTLAFSFDDDDSVDENIYDSATHSSDEGEFQPKQHDSTLRVFSPISQLDGNDDILEEEIEVLPKRYIFLIKLR